MIVDWVQTICIFLVFVALTMISMFNASVKDVQNNWAINRCSPMILPFAGSLAPPGSNITTSDNFSYCIQNIMSSFVPIITQPFSYLQSMTVDMMGSMNDNTASSNQQSATMTFSVSGIIGSIYGIFLNIIVEFNIIIIKLLDAQGKISGIITTLMYVMTAVQYTFESMWNGIPGKMIQVIGKL